MSAPRPPRRLESLVEGVLRGDERGPSVLGDLAEGYAHRHGRSGGRAARWWYARQALSLGVRRVRGTRAAGRGTGAGGVDRLGNAFAPAVRGMKRRPGFALAVIGVLSVAMAAAFAAFSVARGTFEAARWWDDESRAVLVWPEFRFSRGMLSVLREESAAFDVIGGIVRRPAVLAVGDRSASAAGAMLSPELFRALRAKPVLGRGLLPEDAAPGAEPVVVVGHGLWRDDFGADPALVGRVVEVSGVMRRVVGVMPAGAEQPGPETEVWTPLTMDMADPDFWPARELEVAAMTRPGTSVLEARDDVRRVLGILARRFSFFFRPDFGSDATVTRSADREWGRVAAPLLLLVTGTGLLLLVAAIDVGNLVLARSLERRTEMRVRMALGASRWQVVQQFLAEAALHATLAGAVGWVLGSALARRVPALFPFGSAVAPSGAADPVLVLFALGVAVLAWLLMAGIPVAHFLRLTAVALAPRGVKDRAARWLVVTQAALATTLLVTAALLLRTVQSMDRLPLGFDPAGVFAVPVAPPAAALSNADLVSLQDRAATQVAAAPGVGAAGWISAVPLLDAIPTAPVNLEDRPTEVGEAPTVASFVTDARALEALHVDIVRGRAFDDGDDGRSTRVALVNETMARTLWPDRDAVGRRIAVDPHDWTRWITVVGVVTDVRHRDLTFPVQPAFFLPRAQAPARSMRLVVRSSSSADAVGTVVRSSLEQVAPGTPAGAPRALASVVRDAQGPARVLTTLLSVLAALATALGAMGLYGALAGWVTRRRTEIGTRLALGARPRALSAGVLLTGLALTAAGVAIGCVGAGIVARLIRGLLFGVSPIDPIAFLAPAVLLLVTGALAAALPALRAATVPPAQALRGG